MSGRQKQHWIRCVRCRWGDKRVWVPLACPGCGRGGSSWSDAPREVPRKAVDWDKVVRAKRFEPLGSPLRCVGELKADPVMRSALAACFDEIAARWLKEFGVVYGTVVGGRKVEELVDCWHVAPGLEGRSGAWVMVQAWYKRAAGGD